MDVNASKATDNDVTVPPLRVVVVDDDEQHLKFVATLLSQDGVVVYKSADSNAGFDLIRTKHPQLVIADLIMPGLGGMDLLQKIIDFDPAIDGDRRCIAHRALQLRICGRSNTERRLRLPDKTCRIRRNVSSIGALRPTIAAN